MSGFVFAADPFRQTPVRSLGDGTDEKVQVKILGHGTSPTLGAAAQFQAVVDSQGRVKTATDITSSALPLNAATATNQSSQIALETSIDGRLTTLNAKDFATSAKQDTALTEAQSLHTDLNARMGALTETAPATDTASSGLNGRLQRIAQRLSSLIAFYTADFGASSASIRTAAQVGNATGAAAFGAGGTTAQVLRVVQANDQTTTGLADTFDRMKNKNFKDTEEVRYDIPTSFTSTAIYVGLAPAGTATSAASWAIVRTLFDANGNPSRDQIKLNVIWDNRAALAW